MTGKRQPSVIIIGAGMTGILAAIKLQEQGVADIVILEKAAKVGGTWRENTYPGVACDVPAHLYTYSFERNPDFSHRFAHGDEIQSYFERVARKYGVIEKIRFGEEVRAASYQQGRWSVKSNSGLALEADFLIAASGILHHPVKPFFKGMDTFEGDVFHTAEWDHNVDLTAKRVAVIGTGSTAAQLISELQTTVEILTVFQRTAQWILPTPNREFSQKLKQKCRDNALRIPFVNAVYSFFFEQIFSKGVTGNKVSHAIMSALCKLNLRWNVRDAALRKKLTPDYKVGCKRLIMSGTFYAAIQQPNVSLETSQISRFVSNGIETKDGSTHEFDVVVLSTGFDPSAFMRPMNLVGKSSQEIDKYWHHKVQAYRSIMIPDYPNYFLMLGPNTPIGNFNVIQMSEVQVDYALKLIERWRASEFDEVAATADAMASYNRYLKKGMANTVWVSGGCNSWYLDADGDPLSWPYSWKSWVAQMQEPNMQDMQTIKF